AEGAEGRAGRERELARARAENEELREELKTARRRIVDLERRVPFEEDTAGPAPETLAVLLDQANLAATAAMAHRRKVNFAALLDRLSVGRKRKKAVAFVVDNGGTHFDAFCETLRRTGWELRVKKPKQFQDGTSKADWDMGIAVEAVELRGSVETIALVSGDGDFAPLVKLLKRWGMRVEVASFAEGLALDLQNAADAVTVLGSESLE
ncbi:MAG: NYN domain-containing protein, partial [Myxococcota bacterium]